MKLKQFIKNLQKMDKENPDVLYVDDDLHIENIWMGQAPPDKKGRTRGAYTLAFYNKDMMALRRVAKLLKRFGEA